MELEYTIKVLINKERIDDYKEDEGLLIRQLQRNLQGINLRVTNIDVV